MSNINKNINNDKRNNEEVPKRSLTAIIDHHMSEVKVPEGLEPENMMEHIRQLKSEGYFEERVEANEVAEAAYAKKIRLRRVRRWTTALAAVAAVCIIVSIPFGGTKANPVGSYQDIVNSVRTSDADGNYVLTGYRELSQYAVASSSVERKHEEEAKSLFERFVSNVMSFSSEEDVGWDETYSMDWGSSTSSSGNLSGSTVDYSDTNVRTEGIAEADVIKTDGEYIYYIDDEIGRVQLVIAKADGENTQVLSRTDVDYSVFKDYESYAYDDLERFITRELLVDGDKVIMLMSGVVGYDRYSYYNEQYRTTILVYDVQKPSEPQLLSQLEVDGRYESCRMSDGYVYLFTYKTANLNLEDKLYTEEEAESIIAPQVNGENIKPEQIYVTETDEYDSFKIIATIDVDEPSSFKDVMAVLGSGYRLNSYVSKEHIYFISNIYYSFVENVNASGVIEEKNQAEILQFEYSDGTIEVANRAVIDGVIGDEFDIDEYDGYLRMAVTKDTLCYAADIGKYTFFDGDSWYDCEMSEYRNYLSEEECSALCILDENLDVVSELKLQMNESVYGVRFDGDVAYVVTFRQTDPLFAVDLSDPAEPKVMSALKIPGFSTYLHKWDENTLVGIGYTASTGSALKISTFDISDKFDITESNVCKLPSQARSEAPLNHKEIFISPEKNLIGLWVEGMFIVDEKNYEAAYLIYSYVDGKLTEIIKCPVSAADKAEDTRGMYIGEYIYIVNIEDGITVYSMNDYTELCHAE